MKNLRTRRVVRQALCLVSVPLLAGGLLVAQQAPGPQAAAQAPAQLLSPQQLDTLVAPVALYPDGLLSQILAAATYPLEIAEAAQWLQQNPNLQGAQLVDAARQQNWDPSIQALVVFPDVVRRLSSDIRWTTDLGNAFLAQQADVMNAVQRMRAQAQASGKLRSNRQQTVTTETQGDQSAIDIQPSNPEEVYVPYYNPEYIWGPPADGYYPPWDYLDMGYGLAYGFGPGIYIGGFFPGLWWGNWGWGCNWFGRSIFGNRFFFNHYGFGWRGFGDGGIWAHDASHRLGIAYPNSALNHRYSAVSAASARSSYAAHAASRYNSAPRANAAQSSGSNRFGQAGSYRAPAYGGSSAYRASPSYGGSHSMPGYRSGPSYGGSSAYRASPSYSGRSYGGGRAAPSYRSSPSYSGGGSSRSSGGFHSSGGGGFHGGGGGHGGGGHR
jgi:hypothetical protein